MSDEDAHAEKRQKLEQACIESLPQLFRYVYSRTGNATLTQDIVQECVLRLLMYMDQRNWEPEIKSAIGFLMTTARHLTDDAWRRRQREAAESLDETDVEQQECEAKQSIDFKALIEGRIYLAELQRMLPWSVILRGLSEYELHILYLHAAERMKPEEIAIEQDVNVHSLRYDLTKIYGKIRFRAKRYLEETGHDRLF